MVAKSKRKLREVVSRFLLGCVFGKEQWNFNSKKIYTTKLACKSKAWKAANERQAMLWQTKKAFSSLKDA